MGFRVVSIWIFTTNYRKLSSKSFIKQKGMLDLFKAGNYPFSVRGFCTAANLINSLNSAICPDKFSIASCNSSSFNNVIILELLCKD